MFTRSRLRIVLGYVGILALILVAFGIAVVVNFWDAVNELQDEQLTREAQNRRGVIYGGDRTYSGGSDQFGWAAVGADGRPLARVSTGSDLGLPYDGLARQATLKEGTVRATVEGRRGAVRVVSVPLVREGSVVAVVQVAQPRRVVRDAVEKFVRVLIPTEMLALALAALGGLFLSGRAMRPIREAFHKQRTFVADASHELKTPLTLIRIDAEMMARTPKRDDDRELIEHLLSETDRMDAILSDLLALASLDSGKAPVTREPFNLAEVVLETTDRFGSRFAAEGKSLAVGVSGKLPARGDKERTRQVLAALLDNALRYTPQGALVNVSGRHEGDRVEVSVRDSGPGIPPEHLSHVFDRFFRAAADRPRGETAPSTGLGLAIARDLARAQGGDLTATNAQEHGAVLRLSLPGA